MTNQQYIDDELLDDEEDYCPISINQPLIRPATRYTLDVLHDRYSVALIIFYLLGVGSLLPWNFFTTARQYFFFKLRNVTDDPLSPNMSRIIHHTYLQDTFESYLSVSANVPNIIFMFMNMAITRCVRTSLRLMFGLILMTVIFTFNVALSVIDTDAWQLQFFVITMVSIVIMNIGAALMQGSLFGLASMFPHGYTKALMQGQAFGGVIAAVAYILTLWIGANAETSGTAFFSAATVALMLCIISYVILCRLPFTKETIRRNSLSASHVSTSGSNQSAPPVFTESSSDDEWKSDANTSQSFIKELSKPLWACAIAVNLVFTVSLSLYPALLSSIESFHNPDWLLFSPLTCFFVFNAADLIGRSIPAMIRWPKSPYLLVVLSLLRLGFIPMFLMCNYHSNSTTRPLPMVFSNDYAFPIINILFGLTNGYIGTLAMMYGPSYVSPASAETCGAFMSFFLTLGLGVGSVLSFLFTTVF